MKGVVTNRQLFFLLLLTITGYSLISIPGDAVRVSGTGAWITILLLACLFAIGVFFIASLNKMFEGKTIFEYSSLLVGKAGAIVISLIYTAYFIFLSILLFRGVAEFIKASYLPLTPIWVLMVLFEVITFYIASQGITNVGRVSELFGIAFIIFILFIRIVMFFIGDFTNIQPLIDPRQIKESVIGVKDLIVPFLGIEILTIIPFGKVNLKKGVSYCIATLLFIGLFYIIVTETAIMIVGINEITNYTDSLIEALRQTELPKSFLLERADIIFATVGFAGILSCLSIVAFTTVEHASKIFSKTNRNVLFLVLAILTFIVGSYLVDAKIIDYLLKSVLPFWGIFVAFIIPIILYIIAKIKNYIRLQVSRFRHMTPES